MFFIARRYLRTREDVRLVILGFFGLVIQVAIFTALAFDKRQVIAPQVDDLFAWLYQSSNPVIVFGSPSVTIATIVACIPLAAWYRIYGLRNNYFIWSVVLISSIGTAVMSLSRGSWLGIIVALVASLPLYFKQIKIRVIFLTTIILMVLYFTGFFDFISEVLDTRLSSQIDTVSIRLANYQLALQSSTQHIFLGLGLGNYPELYKEFPHAFASRMEPLWFAHSLFLTLIPEIGLTGALAFAYIFLSCLRKGVLLFQKQSNDADHWLTFSFLVAVISYVVVVSTSGGHLIATKGDYLIAPGLIVTLIFLGYFSSNLKISISINQIIHSSRIQRIARR